MGHLPLAAPARTGQLRSLAAGDQINPAWLYGKWDVAAEYRELLLSGQAPGGDQLRRGGLFELSYALRGRLRLGLGYNFSRFSDNELGDLQRDGHGLFIRVVGHY